MKLDDIKKLHQKKYRESFGHFLVEGEHLILELQKAAQHNTILMDSLLLVTDQYAAWETPFKKQLISQRQMAQISDTQTPPGIIAVVPLLPPAATGNQRAIYLHEVQDPGNLGTIIRTLGWFGGFRLLLSPNSVDPYNPKVVRASMGAIFHVAMEIDVPLDSLAARFRQFAYLDMQGNSVRTEQFGEFDCYLFGNEARGVPRTTLMSLEAVPFTIPGSGAIESLNLASAVNICVYQLSSDAQ